MYTPPVLSAYIGHISTQRLYRPSMRMIAPCTSTRSVLSRPYRNTRRHSIGALRWRMGSRPTDRHGSASWGNLLRLLRPTWQRSTLGYYRYEWVGRHPVWMVGWDDHRDVPAISGVSWNQDWVGLRYRGRWWVCWVVGLGHVVSRIMVWSWDMSVDIN